jgi:hypothetical protein
MSVACQTVASESPRFVQSVLEAYKLYFTHGSRSSKKVDSFHESIKKSIEEVIQNKNLASNYNVKLEQNIPAINSSGKKKCDIVVYKEGNPIMVLPVKLPMTNYKQNKNNNWENLTGELLHIKWANPDIRIIPINVFMDKTPYKNNAGKIQKFEHITYKDIENYEVLKQKNIVDHCMNYILHVDHSCKIGEPYDKCPEITAFDKYTPYLSMFQILDSFIT